MSVGRKWISSSVIPSEVFFTMLAKHLNEKNTTHTDSPCFRSAVRGIFIKNGNEIPGKQVHRAEV